MHFAHYITDSNMIDIL